VRAADVVLDARVVVLAALADPPPRPDRQGPVLAVEADHADHPVPAPRVGVATAIGLVVDAESQHPSAPAAQRPAGAEHQHRLGLVVRLAERPRSRGVEHLPAGTLGVAQPQVAIVAEQVLGRLGLEAELELGFAVVHGHVAQAVLLVAPGRETGGVVGVGGPEHRQQVDRFVGAEVEGPELGVAGQLPAAVQQAALAGVRDVVIDLAAAFGAEQVAEREAGPVTARQVAACVDGRLVEPRRRFARLLGQGVGLAGRRRAAAMGVVVTAQPRRIHGDRGAGRGVARGGRGLLGDAGRGAKCDQKPAGGQGGVAGDHGASPPIRSMSAWARRSASTWASSSRFTDVSGRSPTPGASIRGWAGASPARREMYWTERGASRMPASAKCVRTAWMAALRAFPRSVSRWLIQAKNCSFAAVPSYSWTVQEGAGSASTPSTQAMALSATSCARTIDSLPSTGMTKSKRRLGLRLTFSTTDLNTSALGRLSWLPSKVTSTVVREVSAATVPS